MFQKVIGQKPESENPVPGSPSNEKPSGSTLTSAPSNTPSNSAPRSSSPSPSGRNVLSSDVEIKGTIRFSSDLVVDGKIEGHINSDGSLTVGENARIKAEIKTQSVIIYGKVHGNIEVNDKVELKASAELVGDIKAASVSIEPGAIFVGKSTVGTPSVSPQPTSTNTGTGKNKPSNENDNQKDLKLAPSS